MIFQTQKPTDEDTVVEKFTAALSGTRPEFHVKHRPDGDFIVFEFAAPSPRFYELIESINEDLAPSNSFKDRISITTRTKKPLNVLEMPETALLQRELSASLTVDRNTFGGDFLDRYTPSVTGLEKEVVVSANHVVYGRRGSGKSSLLAYAMHQLRLQGLPYCWIAMQTYASRADVQAIASVLSEIFAEAATYVSVGAEFRTLADELLALGESDDGEVVTSKLTRMVPRMRRSLAMVTASHKMFTIFLDDLHVLDKHLQPELLAFIYSLTRGNKTYIKLSGIEQLTNLWDGDNKRGLESPHDIQTLKLDHNLTSPDQSKNQIVTILDRHAKYCGMPKIGFLATDEYIDRLVLSAAAVPRDALSLFSKSISRSLLKNQKTVSITSLNAAASEAVEEKLKDVDKDIFSETADSISPYLDKVKRFCTKQKKNAFLVKIENGNDGYINVQKLVALRFVHVLHEGITPHKAGERYVALMLDFGFYIGIRAARSIELFPDTPRQLVAKELRTLPIFPA
ncbi:ATP-binding protein [Paraburkholderia azotifigens]|uniref:ATP-binding protein n=1 Tax=Paraburkholderia azotifigens TaxID=2057004 RepID=UPI0038BD0F30